MWDRCNRVFLIYSSLSFLLFVSTLEQQFSVPSVERSALLSLRSSLGLRAKEWPIKSDPCTSWVGIQCTSGGVTGINISGFRRTRKGSQSPQFAVDALQNLTLLVTFNASHFPLPGSIPGLFGSQLNALRVLDLSSCSINGVLPSTLGNLSRLSELYLSDNNLTSTVPSSLGQLSELSMLDLSQNSLSGPIPGSFGGLGNLTLLDMSGNFLTGMIPLEMGKLDKLRFLNLSGNNLSSSIPPQLGDLSNLVDLDLGFNTLSGSVPPDLRGLRNLQRLMIGNNFLSGALPANLFPSLAQLRSLVLNRNNFDGNFPDVIWSIPSLQFLDVSENNFTGFLPNFNSSINNTTSAAVLNISHNSFYGNITAVVRRLAVIDLSGNYFEGTVPDYARGNTFLEQNCLQNLPNQRSLAQCSSFYASRGLAFDNFGEPNVTQPPPPPPQRFKKKSHKLAIILASVLGGLGLIVLVISIVILLIFCKRKNGSRNRGISVETVVASGPSPTHVVPLNFSTLGESFTYQQILDAANEFEEANLIKHGHSGDLFRGILEGPIHVVIKKVNLNSTVKESYISELEFFSKVSNPRFVPLVGHCLENENEKFLVYKHLQNGDLSSSLFKNAASEDVLKSLDWITRLKIAIGAAEGLTYLHHDCTPPLVHRDVQASSILLEDKFEVRLGSLSEVCAQVGETHQNRITRLLHRPLSYDQGSSGTSNAACAYDVYCFGKVLLELVTGKLGISSTTDPNITKGWLEATLPYITIHDKELIQNIIDPTLVTGEDLLEEVWAMAVVAKSCLNPKPHRRPPMRYVLKALENPLKVVRDEHANSSARLRASSSRGSWNAALFGSWRHSSSDVAVVQSQKSGPMGSQGSSGRNGEGNGRSSSSRGRQSKEIFPEPLDV